MTPLETIKNWISTYPGYNILSDFSVDYTDQIPANGGIFPSGLVEVERRIYVDGSYMLENQFNFGLYYVFTKAPGDDTGAEINADWIMDFQSWVQSTTPPKFGDKTLKVSAQNGALYDAEAEGTATYMVQLSVNFRQFVKGAR